MSDPDYCYPPDYTVLRNRLGIRDAAGLDAAERDLVTQRLTEPVPQGDFDLDHLTAIHHHLFQDVYHWAGKIRTVSIMKGHSEFQHPRFIETGMRDVHRRLVERRYLTELSPNEFAVQAGTIIGDVNYVHPFREGNGRAQFQYLDQLAQRAGHPLDLKRIERDKWVEASKHAHSKNYGPISESIHSAIIDRHRTRRDD